MWVAQRPAGFAFIEFEDNDDAEGLFKRVITLKGLIFVTEDIYQKDAVKCQL